MATNYNAIKGKPRAINDRGLVSDMHFGEQKTSSGLIIGNDDGKTRGIYPRWAKIYSKGPQNTDEYKVGQWVLVEHGRWTRGFLIDDGENQQELRMVDAESILAYTDERPNDVQIGGEYNDGQGVDIDPSLFID